MDKESIKSCVARCCLVFLLKGCCRHHCHTCALCRLSAVCGDALVTRTKKLPTTQRRNGLRGTGVLQRYQFDAGMMLVVTDQPASNLVVDK